jgi:hypothetical protein
VRRRFLQELGAAFVLVVILVGIAWFGWLGLPADRPVVRAQATLLSVSPGQASRSNPRPPYAMLWLRLDDGMPVTLARSLSCMPKVRPGDRIQLAGLRSKGGPMLWSIVGEPCPR